MRITDPVTGRSYIEKRRARYNEPGQPRELTFCCYRRYAFLNRDLTRQWLCQAIDDARANVGFQVWAYVIMPEHVHLLVYPGETPERMSEFLRAIKGAGGPQSNCSSEEPCAALARACDGA